MEPKVEQNQLQTIDESPQGLISMAIEKGVSIDQLEKLLALKERWDAAQANKAFLSAMSTFQKEVPAIQKKKQVGYKARSGELVGYKYAELGEIDETIKVPMSANGLSKRWEISEDGEKLICTCIISHIDGHTERTTMSSVKDGSGGKNEIQSLASAISYLQRYTLIGALGLTTASEDNDGDGTAPQAQSQSQPQYNPDLPWLNMTDKKGNQTEDGIRITKEIAAGKTTIEQLRNEYKISKSTAEELSKIKVTGEFIEDINHEDIPADKKDFEIPGHWYAKLEKCKSVVELKALYDKHVDTVEANAELKKLFTDTKTALLNRKTTAPVA
jgi:hypothetical protein